MPDESSKPPPKPLDYRRPASDLRIDPPNSEVYSKWLFGALIPICIAGYGIICIIRRVGTLGGEHANLNLTVHGANAVAAGIEFIAAAGFLHCKAFWGHVYESHWIIELCEIIAALLFIGALIVLIIRVGLYGIV